MGTLSHIYKGNLQYNSHFLHPSVHYLYIVIYQWFILGITVKFAKVNLVVPKRALWVMNQTGLGIYIIAVIKFWFFFGDSSNLHFFDYYKVIVVL